MNPFGEETNFSWIPESILRIFFYRDLEDLAPAKAGLYTQTPMVNDDVLREVRAWLRGDIKESQEHAILFNHRENDVPKGGADREELIRGDVCVTATGFHQPSLGFLPGECFKTPYSPPNWFLKTFPVGYVHEFDVYQCHWYRWKRSYWSVHSSALDVHCRPEHQAVDYLDAYVG